ncbi:MAG: hypothetical protein ACTSP4_09630 [Candidatus Hodarchaeales archaeon]
MKRVILKEITSIQPDIPYDINNLTRGYVFTFTVNVNEDTMIIPPEIPLDCELVVPVLSKVELNGVKHVKITVFGEVGASEKAIQETIDQTLFITGLDGLNGNYIDFHSSLVDPIVQKAVKTVGLDYRITSTPATQMLVNAIISQNTTYKQYTRMLGLFAEKYGRSFSLKSWGRKVYHSYPSINTDIYSRGLREIGLGYRDRFVLNALEFIRSESLPLTDEPAKNVIKKLLTLKGVGEYSARCYAIYALRKYEVVFLDSYIRSLLENLYPGEIESKGKKLTIRAFEDFAREKWGSYAAIALDYLVIYYEPIFRSLKSKSN